MINDRVCSRPPRKKKYYLPCLETIGVERDNRRGNYRFDASRARPDAQSHSIFQRKNQCASLIALDVQAGGCRATKAMLNAINQNLNAAAPLIGSSCNGKEKKKTGAEMSSVDLFSDASLVGGCFAFKRVVTSDFKFAKMEEK